MKRIATLACAVAGTFTFASAQTESNPWSIGIYGGLTENESEVGSYMFSILKDGYKFYGHGGLSLTRYINPHLNVSFFGAYGLLGAQKENSSAPSSKRAEFKMNEIYADLTAEYMIVRNEKCRFHPFLFLGVGYRYLLENGKRSTESLAPTGVGDKVTSEYFGKEGGDVLVSGGIGCDLRLNDRFSLRYTCRYGYTFGDDKDTYVAGKFCDQQLMHSFGLKVNFGAPKDSDKDGVPDKFDQCPNTPQGMNIQVDDNGCPLDEDKDGVPDYLDKCPGTPAGVKVDSVGCPVDTDGDGVADYLDVCPDTPEAAYGTVDEKGCPIDSDGDGVADYLDKCPNTPAGAKGFVDENGCPLDSDGDGVYDYEDDCPQTPGVKGEKGKNGCPEVKAAALQIFRKALNGIQFETGKATIKKASYPILNDVVKVMVENPEYKLKITGHTDNVGDPAKNLQLSKDRAESVAKYLQDKGVSADRMKHDGKGDTEPVEPNTTKAGKAKNRRVEFQVVFKQLVEQ